ncbi:hypothetical protein CCACVL1_06241 [Corchorus capsularis]|uniref:Uncharacterized protein n=1 Tax=Corchorus capsularis TaxID=210143 RepID=A0A1R3JGM9_COCAP|nr:hypothetical protein CCACVL1_06241 [Corchorus capsularis]
MAQTSEYHSVRAMKRLNEPHFSFPSPISITTPPPPKLISKGPKLAYPKL